MTSHAAQGRLALCKPTSGLQESAIIDGVEQYAHASGEVFFQRRAAWQVASTMGFVLNKNTGSFMGLSQEEESALHEVYPELFHDKYWLIKALWLCDSYSGVDMGCAAWQQPNSSLVHRLPSIRKFHDQSPLHFVCSRYVSCSHGLLHGPDLQKFDEACREMMCSFNATLPEGSLKARIRCTAREMKNCKTACLGDTLGDEPVHPPMYVSSIL